MPVELILHRQELFPEGWKYVGNNIRFGPVENDRADEFPRPDIGPEGIVASISSMKLGDSLHSTGILSVGLSALNAVTVLRGHAWLESGDRLQFQDMGSFPADSENNARWSVSLRVAR